MDLPTLQAIFSSLQGIASFLIKYGPGLIQSAEIVIADLKLAWDSATSGTSITADQQTQIDAALDAANTALANAVAAAAARDQASQTPTYSKT